METPVTRSSSISVWSRIVGPRTAISSVNEPFGSETSILRRRGWRLAAVIPEPHPSELLIILRPVVAALLRVDLCAFRTLGEWWRLSLDDRRQEIFTHFEPLWKFPPHWPIRLIEDWLDDPALLPHEEVMTIETFRQHVEGLDEAYVCKFLADKGRMRRAADSHLRMLEYRMVMLNDMKRRYDDANNGDKSLAFRQSLGLRVGQKPQHINDYFHLLSRNRMAAKEELEKSLEAVILFCHETSTALQSNLVRGKLRSTLAERTAALESSASSMVLKGLGEEHVRPELHVWL